MMAAFLLALALAAALIGALGWLVLGVTDLDDESGDYHEIRQRHARALAAFGIGLAGLLTAVALAFMAGRV